MAIAAEPTRYVACPKCGRTRRVSGRHARRTSLCRLCRSPAKLKEPTDSDRRFWLKQFTDEEIIDMAFWVFGEEGDLQNVRAWRELLSKPGLTG